MAQLGDKVTRVERWCGNRFYSWQKYFENSIVNCATLRIPSEYLAIDGMLHAYQGIVSPQEMVLHIKTYQTALSHTLILFAS